MDEEDVLFKLLNDNPDPPAFCFYKALYDSDHQCSPPGSKEHHHTTTMLTMSTPVQLKKVSSPRNLELDSDTSSVIAGWSFSMATPTCPWVDAGKNPVAVNSSISTTDEGSSSLSTEDECGSEESPPVKDKLEEDKSLLKIRNKAFFSKHKPVPRTLFPPTTTPLKVTPRAQQLDPFSHFSPIPPAMSPLVCTSHHAQSKTPLKQKLNNSITSTSLFETPVKEENQDSDQSHGASSQDMFGSPEIFTPLVDVATIAEQPRRKPMEAEGSINVEKEEVDVVYCSSKEHSQHDTGTSDQSQCVNKSPSITIPCSHESKHSPSPSPKHKLLSHSAIDPPIIHSTPLYSHNHNNELVLPPPSRTTPNVPLEQAHEPSTHGNELTAPQGEAVCVAATPVKGEANNSTKLSYNFASTDNVLDLLFMSPPELDKHLSKNQHDPTFVESALPESMEDVNEPSKEEVVSVPLTQQDAMCGTVPNSLGSDGQKEVSCGCNVDINNKVMEDQEANDNEQPDNPDFKTHLTSSDDSERKTKVNSDTAPTEREFQPPVKKPKRKITTSFFYPGSKRLTTTNIKKRTRYACIMKRDDLQTAHMPVSTDTCTVEEKVDQFLTDHSDNDEEPPPKKAHIEEQSGEDVTKIDESVMEFSSQNDNVQDAELNVMVLEAVLPVKELPGAIEVSSDCKTSDCVMNRFVEMKDHPDTKVDMDTCRPEQSSKHTEPVLSNDINQTLHSHTGEVHNHALESVIKSSSIGKLKTPGLSRRHPVTRKPQETTKEETCNSQKESDARSNLPPVANQITQTITEKTQIDVPTTNTPFAGFCTAAGSAISISNQAKEKARSLLSGELEWKDNELVTPREQPQKPGASVSPSIGIISPQTGTPTSVESPAIQVKSVSDLSKPLSTSLSAFKTPLNTKSNISHPVSLPNRTHTLSRTKRPVSSFKAPRKADSVSKEEEKASVARILRGFRASGAGPSKSLSTEPVQKKVESIASKRMVSGFSTAAGGKLTISSESMEKAQQLLMSDKENGMVENLQMPPLRLETATDIERSTEMTGFKTASGKGLSVSTSAMDKAKQIANSIDQVTDMQQPAGEVNVPVGFQTASGKSMTVSSEALFKAKSLLLSVSEDSKGTADIEAKSNVKNINSNTCMLQTGFQTAGGSRISVATKSLENARKIVDENNPLECADVKPERCLTGFSTASGSKISILKTSLEKAESDMKAVTETIDNVKSTISDKNVQESLSCSLTAEDVDTLGCFTQFNFHKNNPTKSLEDESQSNIQEEYINMSIDGKDLKNTEAETRDSDQVEEELPLVNEDSHSHYFSTQVVKQLLEFSSDEDTPDDKEMVPENPASIELHVHVDVDVDEDGSMTQECQESVLKVDTKNDFLLDDKLPSLSQMNNASRVSPPPDESHHTSPNPVTSNQESSMHVESLDSVGIAPVNNMDEITTPENNESALNDEQVMLTESMVESMNISAIVDCCSNEFVGLLEARSDVNKNHSSEQHQTTHATSVANLQTASGKDVVISNESLEAAKATLDENMCQYPIAGGFPGLQTASGNPVKISKEALEVVRATLDDGTSVDHHSNNLQNASETCVDVSKEAPGAVNAIPDNNTPMPHSSVLPGLQTASGKKVSISKESLEAARSALGVETPFPGLQTASGTKVDICKESLEAARATLDGNSNSLPSNRFPGLQTASGNKVTVSEESLQAAKAVLGEETSVPPLSGFTGFRTASGNKVSVSKKSLDAARSVLNSNTDVTTIGVTGGFPGLQTASGTQVNVLKESLDAVRATLGDNVCNKDTNSSFSGFQTAGGTKVMISKETLEAARNFIGGDGSNDTLILEEDSCTRQASGPSHTPYLTSQQRISSHSDLTKGSQHDDGKYRPIFKPISACKGRFHVPTMASGGRSVTRESSKGKASVGQIDSSQIQPVDTVRGVVSTPEATLCDRPNHLKHRPLLPSQSHLKADSNLRHSNHSYSHSVPPHKNYSRQHSKNIDDFKTPRRPSVNSMHVQQPYQEMNMNFTSPQLSSNFSRTGSTSYTPISNQPLPPPYTNKSFSYSRTATSKQSDRYSTCTPVWKASLNKRSSNNGSQGGFKNHRRSIVFTPVQKKAAECRTPTSSEPTRGNACTGVNSSFQSSAQIQTVLSSEHPKPNDDAPPKEVEGMRTSTQIHTAGDRDCELAIPLSPLHVTLSQLNAMDDLDMETQSIVTAKDTVVKTTNDSGYVSREVSATKSPTPGSEYDNCRVPSDTCKQKEPCVAIPTSTAVVSSTCNKDESKACEIDDMVFAEVAKEQLDDSLEVDDTELPEDVLYNKCVSSDHRNSTNENTCKERPSITHTCTSSTTVASSDLHGVKAHHTTTNDVIKPQTGSLLAARDEHKSCRIPLQCAVRGHPPGRYTQSELHSFGVHHQVMSVTASNAGDFCFSGSHYFSSSVLSGAPVCVGDGAMLTLSNGVAGLHQFWDAFRVSPGVDQTLISLKWFTNHYKQLVWKLASMECSYPHMFTGRCLTPDWLMAQMKYRYDREIDRAQRPALRKICEHDDVASRRMVLCVSHIHSDNLQQHSHNVFGNKVQNMESGNETVLAPNDSIKEDRRLSSDANNPPCIVLTDGWYSLPGIVDPPLKHMLKSRSISVGTKLLVSGAELLGLSEPCHPLEAPSSCCLKISSNSTRRARWFAKLGYQPVPHPFPVTLESVYSDGGMVGCTHAVIARVYPMVYLEKREGSKNVFRNEKMELKIAAQYETERQKKIDRICTRVQSQFEEELAKQDSSSSCSKGRRSRRLNTLQIKQLQDGEDIYNALTNASDPVAFQGMLSRTQLVLLESYRQCLLSQRQDELQQRIKQAVQEAEDQLPPARNVVPLLKVRLVPLNERLQRPIFDCHLSIWRPNDAVKEILKEGTALRLSNIIANPSNYKGNNKRLQLSATRSTCYDPLNLSIDDIRFSNYTPRLHTPISQLSSSSEITYGEFDTVGIVVFATSGHVPSRDLDRPDRIVDTFYLADHEGSSLEVKVWDGFKPHGLEDTVQAGKSLALSNLSYRGTSHTHQLPTATAGDITTISQQPRQQHLKDALRELTAGLPKGRDHSTFLQSLEDEISSYL